MAVPANNRAVFGSDYKYADTNTSWTNTTPTARAFIVNADAANEVQQYSAATVNLFSGTTGTPVTAVITVCKGQIIPLMNRGVTGPQSVTYLW
jgi:acyl-CoA synthetase (AMP-forming)/AMP-acid ligase II